jgi:hypothetical protein
MDNATNKTIEVGIIHWGNSYRIRATPKAVSKPIKAMAM